MILRGGLFLFCLFNGVLDLLGLIWAWQFFPWVLFYSCFLPLSLSLVPSLLAYFPSAFGKPSEEEEENKHQGSCNHTGLSSFSAEQAEPSFQQQLCGTVVSPQVSCAQLRSCTWQRMGVDLGWHCQGMGQEIRCCAKNGMKHSPQSVMKVFASSRCCLWGRRDDRHCSQLELCDWLLGSVSKSLIILNYMTSRLNRILSRHKIIRGKRASSSTCHPVFHESVVCQQ